MGNFQSISCCKDTRTIQSQLQTILQQQMYAINNADYKQFKKEFDVINLLAEIDFNINQIKYNRNYIQVIHDYFQNVDAFVEFIDSDAQKPILSVIQSKTFHQTNNRYDQVNNRNTIYEHSIVNVHEFATQNNYISSEMIFENIPSESLNKIKLLQRNKQIIKQDGIIFLKQMYHDLMSINGFQDKFWNFEIKESLDSMAFHMYYNLNRYIHFLNNVVSLSDTVSYLKIKQFYHFVLNYFCKKSFQNIVEQYCCQTKVLESEALLYKAGNVIVVTNFMLFSPYEERRLSEGSHNNGMKQLLGDSDSVNKIIKFILKPLSHSESANKFQHFQNLFYVPFSLFSIIKIQAGNSIDIVYLQQIKLQYLIKEVQLINELKDTSSTNHVSINEQNLLNELISLRKLINEGLSQKYIDLQSQLEAENHLETESSKIKKSIFPKISKNYYLSYLKCYQQRKVQLQNQKSLISSAQNLEFAEEQIKVKIQTITTEQQQQMQKQSVLQLVEVKKQKLQQYEKVLHKYIKKHNFQKLQNQIDNIDHFVYLSSLNMSQCWLQKIQHMEMFPNLKELFLYSNLLTKIQGLQNNQNLRLLSLSRNRINKIENIEHLINLKSFYITKNELDIESAQYLFRLPLSRLQLLAISFKQNPDSCFELLLKRIPPKLKTLTINDAKNLTNRCKNNLKKKLKKTQIQFFLA